MPHIIISIEIKYVSCAGVRPIALPTISGTMTAPAYIASTCCSPSEKSLTFDCCAIILCHLRMLLYDPLKMRCVLKTQHDNFCLRSEERRVGKEYRSRRASVQC